MAPSEKYVAPPPSPPLNLLITLYTGFNTLDVHGPLDVICNYALRGPNGTAPSPFNITTTAEKAGPVEAYEGAWTKADESFETSLKKIKDGEYDVLLVPGGGAAYASDLAEDIKEAGSKSKEKPIIAVIKAFYKYDNEARVPKPLPFPSTVGTPAESTSETQAQAGSETKYLQPKWLISVCTGAFACARAGVFEGVDATTHFGALSYVEKVANQYGRPRSMTRQRWADGGLIYGSSGSKVKTRILSSGGISCGLDASLFFLSELFGIGTAYEVAQTMDYKWNVEYTTQPKLM